jgi:fructosamine-3-kinase
LHQYNILFHQVHGHWQLAAILDFDKAWAGHHEIDLARLDLWDGMTQTDFWQTYQRVLPIDPLYAQRRPVYQLLWCLEYADSTPKHLADTQRVCQELNIPLVTNFD